MEIKKIGVVCYGNIARSQILGIYLAHFLKEKGSPIEVYSTGTAEYDAYPDTPQRMPEVEAKLKERGVNTKPIRNPWSEQSKTELETCDVILAADADRKADLVERLKKSPDSIFTFYQFIGEGEKDFEDTYDYDKRCQDPVRFEKCFDELERIARKVAEKLT